MAFLQTIDPFCQPLGPIAATPKPYTIDPFCQPLTALEVPPPPPPPPPPPRPPGAPSTNRVTMFFQCPQGTYWDPVLRRCVPCPPEPPKDPEVDPDVAELTAAAIGMTIEPIDAAIARATAAAIALTINEPKTFEVLAAQLGLEIDKDN